jgi:hypothetical protein
MGLPDQHDTQMPARVDALQALGEFLCEVAGRDHDLSGLGSMASTPSPGSPELICGRPPSCPT